MLSMRYFAFDLLVDFIFVLDIILMFFTSLPDKRGKEEWDSRKVAKHYIKSRRFAFDTLSLLGTFVFTEYIDSFFKFFNLLKMIRVTRINIYINQLSTTV